MKVLDRISMLLRQKGSHVFSLPSDASVYSAIEMMADRRVGALLVVDEGRLVGIVSERDYARKVILQGRSSKDTFIREIMTAIPHHNPMRRLGGGSHASNDGKSLSSSCQWLTRRNWLREFSRSETW